MDLVIVIPCFNEEKFIEGVLHHFIDDTKKLNALIVIVDGESLDRTPQLAQELSEKFDNVEYLNNPKRLQSAALNIAAQKYGDRAPVLIRIDAHSKYPKGFIETLLKEQEKTAASSVVVSMNTIAENGFQKAVAVAQNSKMGNGGSAHRLISGEGKWVDHGHHALFTSESFLQTGGYDESFSHNEDAEYDYRLVKSGGKIWLTGETHLDYYPRSTVKGLFKQYYNFGKGRAKNILKHKIKPKLRQMIPAFILPTILLLIPAVFFPILSLPFFIWFFACLGYGLYLSHTHKDLMIALSGPAAMIMHFAWSCGFWTEMFQKKLKT